jgi:Toprim-like/DNA primase catalytic core, N-terminal domain
MKNPPSSIRDILESLGCSPKDFGKSFRCRPPYRNSGNDTSLIIDKETGKWYDFGLNQGGDLKQLIKITLNITSEEEISKYLSGYTPAPASQTIKIEQNKIYSKDLLIKLRKDYDYWIGRSVSKSTLELLQGGVADNGKMANRFVFPIFNEKDEIIGFSGRALSANSQIKWKHIGAKSNWIYPIKLNREALLKEKSAILVESIGDMLALWEAAIQNVIVCFGVEVSSSIISFLIKTDVKKIFISFNNEPDNNEIGNKAAQKAKDKLSNYFDETQLQIALPTKKDFGEMNHEEIKLWKNNL